MGELSLYKKRSVLDVAQAVHLAPPVMGTTAALDQLSNKLVDVTLAYQHKLDKAEYDKLEAEFGTMMLNRQIDIMQVKGGGVLADPNAPTGNPSRQDRTKPLFERERDDLIASREAFVNRGSNERVRQALGAMWDQGSVKYLEVVADHQIKQMDVHVAEAQAANVAAHQAVFLSHENMDQENINALKGNLLAANDGDTIKTRKEVTATILEQGKQMARRDPEGFRTWVTENEGMLDKAAPGVFTELQTIGRDAWKEKREERKAAEADEEYYRHEKERKASEWAINMVWDTMMGANGTSSSKTMRAIRDSEDLSPQLKNQLLSYMQEWRTKPVRTNPSVLLEHNQAATLGMLDQDQLYKDAGKGIISIEDTRELIAFNRKQQDEMDEPAKANLQRAQQYFKDRFTINNAMGFAMFKTDKDKIQNNIANNMLVKLWQETPPGKRNEIFRMEEKDGVMYMPVIHNIYEQAVRAPVQGFTTTGVKAKNAGMSTREANAAIDKALGQ